MTVATALLLSQFLLAPDADPNTATSTPSTVSGENDPVVLVVAETGNIARYRVREQLARLDFPNDAVGETAQISGRATFLDDGTVDASASAIVIDMSTLESDSDRRDNFLRRNTLQAATHPTATLVPIAVRGLPNPLPSSGEHTFVLLAEFVFKGSPFPTTWEVTATFENGTVTGKASTVLTFDALDLTKPSVGSVLSVADDIRLEYEFRLVPEGA